MEHALIENGFNNPKKIYLNFAGFAYPAWPYSVGFSTFNIFESHQGNKLNQKFLITLYYTRFSILWVEFLHVHQIILRAIILKKPQI
tara:strand:- start:3 stop:263 length:261 start_codon:yes stop_codon:yes gene_type:complete